jgi:uncharacterized repeat protein (TIGR03803 family)
MKFRIVCFCPFTLISLLSLFGFAAQAAAQGYTFNQASNSPNLLGKAGNAQKGKMADSASGYSYSVLYSFCSTANCADGTESYGGLIQDAAGNLYGTTSGGGAHGGGTLFKVDNTGHQTVLYSFCSTAKCKDGKSPEAGLIQDAAGSLYGTTLLGGVNTAANSGDGGGTVFKVDDTGHETVLYSFCSEGGVQCTDGDAPSAGLIQDAAGNLYGTTVLGGANAGAIGGSGGGTVFKVDGSHRETVLYSFCSTANCTDGTEPYGGLIQDAAGNLYGTTVLGGVNTDANGGYGGGTVFKVDSTGLETVLYSFCSVGGAQCADGYQPSAGLIQDAAGNLYGTTVLGGANTGANGGDGGGTVFKVDDTGHETVLYSFCSVGGTQCKDGVLPSSNLIQDAAGNLYGTTVSGGAHQGGTVFKVDNTGHETVLNNFCHILTCTDGYEPSAGLIHDAAGNLYGATVLGGVNTRANGGSGGGTVFKLASTLTVTLTSSSNPSYVDQSVTFSAVVSSTGETPTGSVTFEDGTTVLGTVPLANGKASLTTTLTKSGTASIVASYSGDANYKAANSKPLKQVVQQYTTSTSLASSLNPSTYGQAVTLTATVSSAGPTLTGTVTFKSGTTSLGSASLSAGVAKITTSKLPAGTLTITASYNGDAAFEKSTSRAVNQVVNQATSTTVIMSSVNPSHVGQTVTFTATVTSPSTTPTGTVTFKDGSTELGTGTLAKGKASYRTSTLSAASHNITAVYAGTANIVGSTSPVLVQTVK